MPAHKYFADWYKIAVPDPRQEMLKLREASIEKVASELDAAKGLEVVRIFLGLPTKDATFIDSFADYFKKDDAAFPLKSNRAELQVLAGCIIWECFDGPKPDLSITLSIALALDSATFASREVTIPIPDIVVLTKKFLNDQRINIHDGRGTDLTPLETARAAFGVACKSNSAPALEKPFNGYDKAVTDALSDLIEKNRALHEETNILWWLFGAYSESLNKSYGDLDIAVAAATAPIELTRLIQLLPGPLSLESIISAMLRNAGKSRATISIAETVEAVPKDWMEKRFEGAHIEGALDLCPVTYAMKKSLDTPKKNWRAAAYKVSQTSVAEKITPVELAKQLLKEHLLLKSLT